MAGSLPACPEPDVGPETGWLDFIGQLVAEGVLAGVEDVVAVHVSVAPDGVEP